MPWIAKDWDSEEAYTYPCSFCITKIESGKLTGKLSRGSGARKLENWQVLSDLTGKVSNGMAACQFSSKDGEAGVIDLTFKNNSEIEATLKYAKISFSGKIMNEEQYFQSLYERYDGVKEAMEYYHKLSPMHGNYVFRPYNIADVNADGFMEDKTLRFKTELNPWGEVYIISGMYYNARPFAAAYLIDEQGDVLYCFEVPHHNGYEILNVSVEDLNADGLEDVKMMTGVDPPDHSDTYEWIFYHGSDGGWFRMERGGDTTFGHGIYGEYALVFTETEKIDDYRQGVIRLLE